MNVSTNRTKKNTERCFQSSKARDEAGLNYFY